MFINKHPVWKFIKRPKTLAAIAVTFGLAIYLLGFAPLLLLTVLGSIAIFLPMPKIMDSWFSRLVLSFLFGYAFIQIAAVAQFFINPGGQFKLIAVLFALLTIILIGLFGKADIDKKIRVISAKDICALLGCVIFIVPFSPILLGNNSTLRIAKIGGTQIADGIAHYGAVSDMAVLQNLGYKAGTYYPSGFHIAASFIENSLLGNYRQMSWNSHVFIYFFQYITFGILLCYVLIYLGYSILYMAHGKPTGLIAGLSLALSIGAGVTITELWLFMNEGFLNYYYIAAALFAGLLYVFEKYDQDIFKSVLSRKLSDKWPVTAYLVLTIGASLSWPLVVIPVLIRLGMWIMPAELSSIKKLPLAFLRLANVPIIMGIVFHLIAVYFQVRYAGKGQYSINANGALHSFDIPLLIIGVIGVAIVLSWNKINTMLRNYVVIAVVPYIILMAGLMLLQYFLLGEARYYLIKSSEILEMLLIVIGVSLLVYAVINRGVEHVLALLCVPVFVVFIIVGSLGLSPQPLQETRELFRDYSRVGKPPFLDSDTKLISGLGIKGRISEYNLTILHYDAAGNRLYSQIETAVWANAMASFPNRLIVGNCFGKQYSLIGYQNVDAQQQQSLTQAVKECAQQATRHGLRYYIVTDGDSIVKLREVFGDQVVLIS